MAKRSSGGGGFGRFIAFLLALIVGAGVVLGIVYRKQVAIMWGDLMRYFKRVDDEVPKDENDGDGADDENGATGDTTDAEKHDNMLVSDVDNNGLTLAMTPLLASDLSPQAESGLTITATILPEEATDKTLDWTITWADSSNSWAQGKKATDYVTITPASDGSNVAKLECYKPFGAPLVVKSTSRSNPNAYATCTLDYYARITGATVRIGTTDIDMGAVEQDQIQVSIPSIYLKLLSGGNTSVISNDICGTTEIEVVYETSIHTIPLNAENANVMEKFYIDYDFSQYLKTKGFDTTISTTAEAPTLDNLPDEFDLKYYGAYCAYFKQSGSINIPGLPTPTFDDYLATNGSKYLSAVNSYEGPAYIILAGYQDEMNDVQYALSLSYQKNYFNIAVSGVEIDNSEVVL